MSSIEPSQFHTVCIRPVMPPKQPNTYREKMIARFGRIPSMAELASMERGEAFRHYVQPKDPTPGDLARRAALVAKGDATRADIMSVLTKPMTCTDIANAIKRTHQLINRHLVTLKDQGKVTGRKVKGVTVWEAIND